MIHFMFKENGLILKRSHLSFCWAVILLFLLQVLPHPSWSASQEMSELRQGRLHIFAEGRNETLTVRYQPEYGLDEPLLFLGPDGRLIKKVFLGHKASGAITLNVDKGPGHYVLILKSSYLWHVSLSEGKMVFEPPVEITGVKRQFSDMPFFFQVPAKTSGFDFYVINHRSYKGKSARVKLSDPHGRIVSDKELPKVDTQSLLKKLKSRGVDLSEIKSSAGSGNFNPPFNPIFPERIHVNIPEPGTWKVEIGTKGTLVTDNVGFWIEGIPSYFSNTAEGVQNTSGRLWLSGQEADFVPVSIKVSNHTLNAPTLGVVGFFGPKNGWQETKMAEYGIQAEKVFVSHTSEERVNDNADPNVPNLSLFRFNDQKHLFSRPGKFSLVVLDRFAGWLKTLSPTNQALEWGEWAQVAACNMMTEREMNPDSFVIQFLNEANKILKLEQYLGLLKTAGSRIKKDPKTRTCRIGAPAIATGLSLHKQPNQDFLDTRWIEQTLKQADPIVDDIVFNVYGASELEDTFLYTTLIEKIDALVKKYDSDNVIEPIIIGATNRQGGLVTSRLFCEWEGAVWWASVLTQVINTGKIKAINYFKIIDKGIRKKGLFTADRKPKAQAVIQQLFSQALSKGQIFKTETDHSGVEAVSVKTEKGMIMILVNKSSKDINASISAPYGSIKKMIRFKGQKPSKQDTPTEGIAVKLPPASVTWVELG
ncbi:hypothetical protein DO021_19340 [Desulfobacter hydrogenophilus]|uniref:Glycosyl hydrolase family 30 beta sandwich domain-containing protein n=1 Tax=Desulfobacter hydrogenophilus TaxID=2291 RepID=A0A328FBI9_9BACT|nr:hypothetical protein [Desulfobacter hydrogenophilus]NDY73892.1 hypothetical protein [Desulfobacter hydrogenophilus]QBH13260.1 hypothetical protein EYB58_10205 [Desulfobacter hydrogenophilus]RAM00387.1 hypothetical protein DO021_19340 [Desulfobacter hydrogenophilus]